MENDMGFHANEFVDDMMLGIVDNPLEYADVMDVISTRVNDDGVGIGSMMIRTSDGDVVNVIIIVQSIM